jgi:hypothetical protein
VKIGVIQGVGPDGRDCTFTVPLVSASTLSTVFWEMEDMTRSKRKGQSRVEAQALRLLNDPQFLYKAGQKIGDLGVVGEERNRLILSWPGSREQLQPPHRCW